jgi:acetoacetyl-CoA synthetase
VDWITVTSRGSIRAFGRSDATLNRGGVRLGSSEIYAVVEGFEGVSDSLVAGVELPDGEYYMPLFVVPAGDATVDDGLRASISAALRSELSPRHVPDEIVEVPAIPRTLTGKKLEVPVKRILQGTPAERAAAAGSLDRPEAIQWFERFAQERLGAVTGT